ncbi:MULTISPECIES: tetratricopeptide repeat protein [unclassified Brevundimonas]|uniref:tetratricopeptide repeat protein n=1 Tax=unclassified Brevundimonas TaxID=2622653 RepID=UPI0025BB80BC|nr:MULTISPECIES: hypothetical protein [unclassified Brevundimonas]
MSGARATKRVLKTSAAAAAAGVLVFAPLEMPLAVAQAGDPIEIRIGANDAFTRVEFAGVIGRRAQVRQQGQQVIVRLGSTAAPDVSRLKVDPPKGITKVETRAVPGATELVLTLADGAAVGSGSADGSVWVNIRPDGPVAQTGAAATGSATVPLSVVHENGRARLTFGFKSPVAAAVFKRGNAVWAVFDTKAAVQIKSGEAQGIRWAAGPDYTVVRIEVSSAQPVSAIADGSNWIVSLGESRAGEAIEIVRDDEVKASLAARMSGARRTIWITDPMSGERIATVPALGPVKGVAVGRRSVEANILPTAQGMAVESYADDLTVQAAADRVVVSRSGGLKLSSPKAALEAAGAPAVDAPRAARFPGLVQTGWANTGTVGFSVRHRDLQRAAQEEMGRAVDEPRAPVEARLAYARFLVGSGLHYEAIGILNALIEQTPGMLGVPEVRGLRGAARASIGRLEEAETDFTSGALANDPASRVWQGYIASQQADWATARRMFAAGASAVDAFPAEWRARFGTAHAMAALETDDKGGARELLNYVFGQPAVPAVDRLAARLVQARLLEAEGQSDRAMAIYTAASRAGVDNIRTTAKLGVVRLSLAKGTLTADKAAKELELLKWRWRGDGIELAVIQSLGELYLSQGRYREALTALKTAGSRITSLPGGARLQEQLDRAFRAMFLEGAADGLQPVQALALFFDFRELTPVGADGDEMVRRLARRLIDVDLLDQAAELLKYQAENRLDGVARAQVSANLAAVYLMNRQPEPALQALWSSRSTLLPNAVAAERRALEARALMELGRFDHAIEVLGRDASPAARQVRAEILWKQEKWGDAAALYEQGLGERYKDAAIPLTAVEETHLIRAGVGYSLARNGAALTRLSSRYSGFAERARSPGAVRIALAGLEGQGSGGVGDFGNLSAQADAYAGWIAQTKAAFRERTQSQAEGPANAAARPAAAPAAAG